MRDIDSAPLWLEGKNDERKRQSGFPAALLAATATSEALAAVPADKAVTDDDRAHMRQAIKLMRKTA